MLCRALACVALAAACTTTPTPTASPTPAITVTPATPSSPPTPVSPASASVTPTATPSSTPEPTPPTPVVGDVDADRAHSLAVELATQVGVRPAGSDADPRARAWVRGHLRRAGWSTREDRVPLPQGGQTANVVAWLAPRPPQGPHIVIGAHLDTVAGSPGANDNATGIGVIVALAEELADERPALPVVLVAFGAEEYQPSDPRQHHLGSEVHAAAYGDDVVAMLSVDMVGVGPTTCICWFEEGSDDLPLRLGTIGERLGGGYEVRPEGDISDHGPFARRGIPAAFLWTGDDGRYHTPADTAEHLEVADIARAGALALAFARGEAG